MTAYKLYIKSDISDIDNKALHSFLAINGYNVAIKEESCEITFNTIVEAQNTENKLRPLFTCKIVIHDDDGTEDERLVNITSFKQSGKYYNNFNVAIPVSTKEFELVDALLNSKKPQSYFAYYGHYANDVPFIIPIHAKPSLPYEKM